MLAQRYSKHLQRTIDPMSEVATTVGASQALYLTLQALVDPGDEVVLFEPFYPFMLGAVHLAGAVPRVVRLNAPDFEIDHPVSRSAHSKLQSSK